MRVLSFRYSGRVGHFLRAEMNASALSYPVPPRTALLGLLGNILGLGKDESPRIIGEALIAVGAPAPVARKTYPPRRHYHKANVRAHALGTLQTDVDLQRVRPARPNEQMDDPTGLGAAKQVIQEWLIDPEFTVYVGAPKSAKWFTDLEDHLRCGRSHFTPCLGLAWMLAQVEWINSREAEPLPAGTHLVHTVCPRSAGQLDTSELARLAGSAVQELRLPQTVSSDRVFTHDSYFLEMNGRPIPVRTLEPGRAWGFGSEVIVFL